MPTLTLPLLCAAAQTFSAAESLHADPSLFGVTDGKAIGTYLEHKFRAYLYAQGYDFVAGNSASGIDFPALQVDMKVTSIRQPQSSCPFKSARQKVYGLGYALIVFVYDKRDDAMTTTATLSITDTIFVAANQTADFQITKGLRDILDNQGNVDDLVAFLTEKHLPLDDIALRDLAQEIVRHAPEQGYLTISNALQWRLQYSRVIEKADMVAGVTAVYRSTGR